MQLADIPEEEKSVKCHLCEERMEGVKPKTRVEMSLDAIQGRMVVIEIEQTSGETPFYVLRYMDPETQTFGTFTPARDSYSIFAVAMKMAQIASGTRGALRKKLRRATAFSKPRPHLNNTAVGADNVMQVVELGEMSEYIHEAEREEDGEGREGERWPDIRGSSTQRQKGQLKMITDLLKTEVRGEVRATRECKWIRGWARQWDLEVTHYKYARKNQPSPMEQDGRQGEGCAGERLTRVEYTERHLDAPMCTMPPPFWTRHVVYSEEMDEEFGRERESKSHEEFGSEKAESETEPGTEGEEHVPPVRRLCTQKPSDGDQEAKQRALNVGKHLYRMNAVMERCEQLQDKGFVGGVTMEAQKELSRRSTARIQRGHKAGTGDGRRIIGGIVEDEEAVKEARAAWDSKMEEFMQRRIEAVVQQPKETMREFRERQARACLPEEKHWKYICCACGGAAHDAACGSCISPQSAAHADAFVRTAFRVELDETIEEGEDGRVELCLKATNDTLQVLKELRTTTKECGAETTTMAHLYPGVVWGEKQVEGETCEIENADFFAAVLSCTKGGLAFDNPDKMEVYAGTVHGTPYQTDGVEDLTYRVGTEQQKVQVSLQLANESTLNTLKEGDHELTVVRDWERCQLELESDGTVSTRQAEIGEALWSEGTQVRVFYGTTPQEKASHSKWEHRRPRMWNAQERPDATTEDGLRRIAREARQVVEHVTIGRNDTVYFDPRAPRFTIGCDTQLPEGGHVAIQKPMLGVGVTNQSIHEETMKLNSRAFALAETAAQRIDVSTVECVVGQCSLPGCIPYKCRVIRKQGGRLEFTHGDCANRRKRGKETTLEWRKYQHDKGIDSTRYTTVSEKKAVEEYTLDHVMSAFGHCMSGPDSIKMWALQVAATNDKGKWCEQVDKQELELRIAIVLAGIYTVEVRNIENGGPRFLANYDAKDTEEENVVICGACHTACTRMGKGKSCTEVWWGQWQVPQNKCESKGQIHGCTQQGCSSKGVRRACMDCVEHTSEREKVYIQRVGDVDEVMQTRVREAVERERAETTAGGHPAVNQAKTHRRRGYTNKAQDGRTTGIPPPGAAMQLGALMWLRWYRGVT